MSVSWRQRAFGWLRAVAVALALLLVALSALPVIPTDLWAVRMADFPRLQILIGLAVAAVLLPLLMRRRTARFAALMAAVVAAIVWQTLTLAPYLPVYGARSTAACPAGRSLSIMVINVQMGNRRAAALVEMVRSRRPDVLFLMETDSWWNERLAELLPGMPHTVAEIGGDYFGLHLFSRLPLVDPQIRHLAPPSPPSVDTGVALADGTGVRFLGLHPKPPKPSRSTEPRDSQLMAAADLAAGEAGPVVVAGDLNAVPWESTIIRMRDRARLVDPRRRRGYFATYDATSWSMRWPLDHVFHGVGARTVAIERLGFVGSDHFPFMATVCFDG